MDDRGKKEQPIVVPRGMAMNALLDAHQAVRDAWYQRRESERQEDQESELPSEGDTGEAD